MGTGCESRDLFGDLAIISLRSTPELGLNISALMELLQILVGDSDMILLLMIIVFFPHREIAELIRQEFNGGKMWKIYISVISHQVPY